MNRAVLLVLILGAVACGGHEGQLQRPVDAGQGQSSDGSGDAMGRAGGRDVASGVGGCTPLDCTLPNGTLRCGLLMDACGNSLDCGMICGGLGTCGAPDDEHACSCGACGLCKPGYVWYRGACCLLNTCATNPLNGSGPLCGDVSNNCGGTLRCSTSCPPGGVCGVQGVPSLCSCWIADYETVVYPCPAATHNYDCEGGGFEQVMPTIPGCIANATDPSGSRWCCP